MGINLNFDYENCYINSMLLSNQSTLTLTNNTQTG